METDSTETPGVPETQRNETKHQGVSRCRCAAGGLWRGGSAVGWDWRKKGWQLNITKEFVVFEVLKLLCFF